MILAVGMHLRAGRLRAALGGEDHGLRQGGALLDVPLCQILLLESTGFPCACGGRASAGLFQLRAPSASLGTSAKNSQAGAR